MMALSIGRARMYAYRITLSPVAAEEGKNQFKLK